MPAARQSLARELTALELELAAALESVFATGEHSIGAVAAQLQQRGVPLPSGSGGWTAGRLEEELRHINAALDAAYGSQLSGRT